MRAYQPVPYEAEEQSALFSWANLNRGKYPELAWMYHVPNEGVRTLATGARMRREGLRSGVPDICLPAARGGYHGLYIEIKRREGGRLSDKQQEWLEALNAAGYKAIMCRGWEEAATAIEDYLQEG